MTTDEEPTSREESVLVEYYLRVGEGEEPNLGELCEHDAELVARVEALLEGVPSALQPRAFADGNDDPRIGTSIDGFRILSRLGRGGMGSVYHASQERPRRRVALKLLDRTDLSDERARRRFQREADLVASLDHPNIVPIYAAGESDGSAYLAMKRLEGPSLDDMPKPFTARHVAEIGRAIASALDVAHRFGIVHRDVKPSNVLMDNGAPVLVDFGLARSVTDVTLTNEGDVAGTLPYLAPECLSGAGPALDPRADVYGLGATLYELLAGRPPFDAESTEVLLSRIAWDDHTPLDLARADRDLATIIDRALEKNPQDRLGSMAQFADELTRFLEGRPLTLRRVGWGERCVRWVRRHPRLAASALVVGVTIGTLLTLMSMSRADERRARASAVALARVEMDAERYGRASEILEQIRAPRPAELTLAAEARAYHALEELLDIVTDFSSSISEKQLRSRMDRVIRSGAPSHESELATLALALSHWHLGDDGAARELLNASSGELPWERARSAMLAILDEGDWDLAEATGDDVDEYVITATVMRLAGRLPEEAKSELQVALARDPQHQRARVQQAVQDLDEGRVEWAVLRLQGLTRERTGSRTLRRHLARAQLRSRDFVAARRSLELIARDEWTSAEAVVDLDLLANEVAPDEALEAARKHLADFAAQGEPAWDVVIAEASQLSRDAAGFEDAIAQLERVEREAHLSMHHDKAAANRFAMLVDASTPLADIDREHVLRELVKEGDRLLRLVRYSPARSLLEWKYGKALAGLGYFAGYIGIMEKALPRLNHLPWARHEYAADLLKFADHQRRYGSSPSNQVIVRHFERSAWDNARVALKLTVEGDPTSERLEMLAVAIDSARRLEKWSFVSEMLDWSIAESLPESDRTQLRDEIGDFGRQLDAAVRR